MRFHRVFMAAFLSLAIAEFANAEGGAVVNDPNKLQSAQIWAVARPGEVATVKVEIISKNEQDVSIFNHKSGARVHFFNNLNGPNPTKEGIWTSPKNEGTEDVVYVVTANHKVGGRSGQWVFSWTQVFTAEDKSSYIGVEEGDDKGFNDVIIRVGRKAA